MKEVETAAEVKEKYIESLLKIDGVMGVGIGLDGDDVVIVVNVERISDEILARIPESLDGFDVKVEEVGSIEAVDNYEGEV